jgi:Xaa-Pro aminopeptidase
LGVNRDLAFEKCQPEMELAFSLEEYKARLRKIRTRMAQDDIDVLWLMSPEALFYVGEPAKEVMEHHNKAAGVFDVVADILRPNLPVAELINTTKAYFEEVGIWSEAAWVGGYELGLAFPPDWLGNYVYEMTDTDADKIFEPGTVVNFESQFFSPNMSGIAYYIDTLMFKKDKAFQPLKTPLELVILEG